MIKIIYFTVIFSLLSFFTTADELPYVLVSVAPHQFFVEKIAGSTIDVGLMVPAGASAHTFEPTPKQMMQAAKAAIWFRVGETFEDRAIESLKSHYPDLIVVDMRKGLDLIKSSCSHHAHQGCHAHADLHFWLSTKMAKIQAQTIASALIENYPDHKELYLKNLKIFQDELNSLDHEILTILKPIKNRNILVSHPAYAYFCRDYHLTQYSIEFEGRDPAPQQLTKTLNLSRELQIHTIFVQPQYSNKGARLIANEIGAKVVTLDPYSKNYFETMRIIAQAFAEG